MDRDKDIGYSSLEDLQDNPERAGEQTPRMVIEAVLSRLRARAGCRDESFVSLLNTSLLSRMARHIFRNWDSARRAVANGQRTEMPDLMTLVTDELRNFGSRREVSEEYDRRNLRENLVLCELEEQRRRERGDYLRSPRRRQSLSQSYELDPTLNLDQVQPVRFRSSPDSPVSPATGASDFEGHRSYQRTERMRYHRSHSKSFEDDVVREQRRIRHARKSLESLEISLSPRRTDPNSNDEECAEVQQLKNAPKDVQQPAREDSKDLPTPEESSLQGAEGGANPEDSTTPSDDLSASLEEQKLDTEGTGARNKDTQKERSKKRTRRIIEGLSTRQLVNLRNQSISRMDALEMLIQLSASFDRLDRLVNGSRSRASAAREVDMTTLQEFFDSLEVARSEETANRVAAEENSNDAAPGSTSSVPTVTEKPIRDPRADP